MIEFYEQNISCPVCGAGVGKSCVNFEGRPIMQYHGLRVREAGRQAVPPRASGPPTRTPEQLVALVDVETRARIVRIAERRNVSEAAVVRAALEVGLVDVEARFAGFDTTD